MGWIDMTTFDEILPKTTEVLERHGDQLGTIGKIIINRDLNGRVRLIVHKSAQKEHGKFLRALAQELFEKLQPHVHSVDDLLLYEEDMDIVCAGAAGFALDRFQDVQVIDRLAVESHWDTIAPIAQDAPRIAFYSIKGGVGRSTALAVSAWSLAQSGKRVLVLDLDLESPGLSSALLPEERRPAYGTTDWLIEDLIDNGDAVIDDLVATSALSHDGEIYVVPAHGVNPGEYISKLGRVWMPKILLDRTHENWSQRLYRLIDALEKQWRPDVILLDSRAGIDEVASSCVTDLGAQLVLLFAIDGEQTWSGYRTLFEFWKRSGRVEQIRDRLQLVGAMIPDDETRRDYFERLRESSEDLFTNHLYDEIPPGESEADYFSFDGQDETAPHYPWAIRWNRGFAALYSMHARLRAIEPTEVEAVFGPLISGIDAVMHGNGENNV